MDNLPQTPRALLRDFARFVTVPSFAVPAGLRAPGAARVVATMLALNIAVLFAMLPLLHLWQQHFHLSGVSGYDNMDLKEVVPLVVVGAPVLEETVFRGWLSGRPWLMALSLGLFAFFAVLLGIKPDGSWLLATVGAGLVALPLACWLLRKWGTPRWFERGFAGFLYASAAVFALFHLVNYPHASALYLPMVLPQLWAGFVLGWVRTRVALPASMLVHGLSNGAALALALAMG